MSKFPPIPRLSIVVPVSRNLAAFETSLISVLENQPTGCEVIVCHDGRYDDPFELAGEVRFVVGSSDNLVDLVAAGTSAAHGRFIHVLAGGLRATAGWTDEAVEKFEHYDAGVVASVIRSSEHKDILAAGWFDGRDRLCQAAATGQMDVPQSVSKISGAYLQASFWRRDLLHSLGQSCDLKDELEATYAYEHLSRRAGWRCVLAEQSEVLSDDDFIPGETSSIGRGKRLRAIRNQFTQGGWSHSCKASLMATIANLLRPSMMAEAMGQSLAPTSETSIAKCLRPSDVLRCEQDAVIHRMPTRTFGESRRAA